MKKLVSLFLSVVMLLGVVPVATAAGFADVDKGAWYAEAVDYVVNNKLMSGYGADEFAPDDTLTRAMVVQVLYNREGQPAQSGAHGFNDVKSGDWFNNAVTWGTKRGVVSGKGEGKFAPNDNVTIEQIAVILWNYAGNPATSGKADSLGSHSSWAANGLAWAAENGILDKVPFDAVTDGATRAQTAQILTNFFSGKAAPVGVTGITLDITSHKMGEDWTQYLTATLSPTGAKDTITWTSSDPKVATVNEKGKVSGVAGGTATITATTSNGKTATCKVEVWHSHELFDVDVQYKGTVEYYECACGHWYENWIPREFKKYTNRGFTLSIPAEYADLLVVEKGTGESLFEVYEKASWEAGKVAYGYGGCGFLFDICYMDEAGYREWLDIGVGDPTLLAVDAKGKYYVAMYPSDVQFVRVDKYGNALEAPQLGWDSPDVLQWQELTEWAWEAPKFFADDNAILRKVSDLERDLRNYDYWEPEFAVGRSGDEWAYYSDWAKSRTYLRKLWKDVTLTPVSSQEVNPGGAYVAFWDWDDDSGTVYYVFTDAGENHIICVQPPYYDEYYQEWDYDPADREYYIATKNGKNFNVGKVVTDWWNSIDK